MWDFLNLYEYVYERYVLHRKLWSLDIFIEIIRKLCISSTSVQFSMPNALIEKQCSVDHDVHIILHLPQRVVVIVHVHLHRLPFRLRIKIWIEVSE